MTKNTYNKNLEELETLKSEISNCKKNSTIYALDFAFEAQKDLHKGKLTSLQAKDIENKLYTIVSSFTKNCSCKKYK